MFETIHFDGCSSAELLKFLGERFRDYRIRMNKTQEEIAHQSGISLSSIRRFESGKAGSISLASYLSLLQAIGRIKHIDSLTPELPESPYTTRQEQPRQRIRHKKV